MWPQQPDSTFTKRRFRHIPALCHIWGQQLIFRLGSLKLTVWILNVPLPFPQFHTLIYVNLFHYLYPQSARSLLNLQSHGPKFPFSHFRPLCVVPFNYCSPVCLHISFTLSLISQYFVFYVAYSISLAIYSFHQSVSGLLMFHLYLPAYMSLLQLAWRRTPNGNIISLLPSLSLSVPETPCVSFAHNVCVRGSHAVHHGRQRAGHWFPTGISELRPQLYRNIWKGVRIVARTTRTHTRFARAKWMGLAESTVKEWAFHVRDPSSHEVQYLTVFLSLLSVFVTMQSKCDEVRGL